MSGESGAPKEDRGRHRLDWNHRHDEERNGRESSHFHRVPEIAGVADLHRLWADGHPN